MKTSWFPICLSPLPSIFSGIALAALAAIPAHSTSGRDLLFLDFNDTAQLGKQPGSLPAGTVNGDVTPSKDFPGTADMGLTGNVSVTPFHSPTGPFSVEARFLLRDYAPESSRFVNDILNTATWDTGPSQGFALRNGGSYLYPPLPRAAFPSDSAYQNSLGWYSYIQRGDMSRCVGEFAMAELNDSRNWKEVYTDRCLDLNVWTHMVGVWDGQDMHVFVNGWEATDGWRINGQGQPPRLDSVVTAFAGARYNGSFDSRHLNGLIDYVRVVDSAMSPEEINRRYRQAFDTAQQAKLCTGVILPVSPRAGECAKKDSEFKFKVVANQDCAQFANQDYHPGDSVEVEFAKDPDFTTIFLRMDVTDTSFRIDGAKLQGGDENFAGSTYWRARLKHVHGSGLGKIASVASLPSGEWSSSRAIVLDLRPGSASIQAPLKHPRTVFLNPNSKEGLFLPDEGKGEPKLYTLEGKALDVRFEHANGGWRLSANKNLPMGLMLWRTK